jgi:hypothetical protein
MLAETLREMEGLPKLSDILRQNARGISWNTGTMGKGDKLCSLGILVEYFRREGYDVFGDGYTTLEDIYSENPIFIRARAEGIFCPIGGYHSCGKMCSVSQIIWHINDEHSTNHLEVADIIQDEIGL